MSHVKLKSNKLFSTLSEHIITERVISKGLKARKELFKEKKVKVKFKDFCIPEYKRREITAFLNYLKSKADPKDLSSKIGVIDLDKLIEELGGIEWMTQKA